MINFFREKFFWIILIFAILYSYFYISCIKKGTFFTPDAGLKYLQTIQICRGNFNLEIIPPSNRVEKSIWQEGFFPFSRPFVYKIKGKYYSVFPWLFSLLSAPFVLIFGFYGIYFIPAISLLGLWIFFIFLLKKEKFSPFEISLFLFLFIFSTPITFYGFTYWEHTLSLFLLMLSIFFIKTDKNQFFTAFFLTLSYLFRPEILLVAFFLLIYSLLKKKIGFFIYTILFLSLYFLVNTLLFGVPSGIRSLQIFEKIGIYKDISLFSYLMLKLKTSSFIFKDIFLKFLKFSPFYLLTFFFLPFLSKKNLFYFLFLLIIPVLTVLWLPNSGGAQWGIRYFLPFVLISFLIFIFFYKDLTGNAKKIFLTLFVVLNLISLPLNTFTSVKFYCLNVNYKYENLIKVLKSREEKTFLTVYKNTAMDLATFFDGREIYLSEDGSRFSSLMQIFYKIGIRDFLIIKENFVSFKVPHNFREKNFSINSHLLKRSLYGEIYRVELIPETTFSDKFPQN